MGKQVFLKALSIRQPWAELIIQGTKNVENRTWQIDFGGYLIIHAGNKVDKVAVEWCRRRGYNITRMSSGLIGIARVHQIVNDTKRSSEWHEPGYWGWYFDKVGRFHNPIPFRGRLYLFDVPTSAIKDNKIEGWRYFD